MKAPVSRLRRTLYVLAAVGLTTALVAACSSDDRPNGSTISSSSSGGTAQDLCGTPHEGCECLEPGAIVECGEVKNVSSDGFVQCSMGTRQCLGGAWGKCFGETDVKTKSYMASGLTGTLALGSPAKCGSPGGGPADPCDPYCNAIVDDPIGLVPEGGLGVIDGALVVPPTTDGGDASAPGTFTSTAGGVSTCGSANNVVATSCSPGTAAALTQCQQDFHCDTLTSKCLWNGGLGYIDPSATGGIDLTVGAPCGPNGSAPASVPVCNRGDTKVPASSIISLWVTPTLPSGCTNLGAATTSVGLTADLMPGACTNIQVPNSAGAKFITVNAGPSGSQTINEIAGRCANNSAFFQDDGALGCGACTTCNTQVSGKVYDPTGYNASPGTTYNNLPLPGIDVFQPSAALTPLNDGVACDSCASIRSPSQTLTVTGSSGSFTLDNVSPGTNVPIVVQSGRWRRTVNLNIAACTNNTFPAGTFRMPRDQTEGSLPKMAVVTGQLESLSCLMRKIGVSASEIGGSTGAADPKRVQIFKYNGMDTSPAAPSSNTLFTPTVLSRYTAVIEDCPAQTNNPTSTAAMRTAVRNYVDGGGRVFADHWAGDYLLNQSEFVPVATWDETLGTAGYPAGLPAKGRINSGTAPETLLSSWLADPGVAGSTDYGAGWIRVDEARSNARNLVSGTYPWIRGQTSNSWGPGAPPGAPTNASNYSLSFSFDTPFPGGTCGGGGTGRVVYNGMHVNPSRGTTGTYPGSCNFNLGLSPEEKALEFQIFQLTACAIGGGAPPPPPAPPPPLATVNYYRDYRAVCGVGERVKWGPFYWESLIVPGTNIAFRAATSDTLAGLPTSPPAAAPTTANVGTANATVLAPAWDCSGCPGSPATVDAELKTDTGTASKEFLRIYMQFNPTPLLSPALLSWRQLYDCVPSE